MASFQQTFEFVSKFQTFSLVMTLTPGIVNLPSLVSSGLHLGVLPNYSNMSDAPTSLLSMNTLLIFFVTDHLLQA